MEKYKKKLQEGADLRQQLKVRHFFLTKIGHSPTPYTGIGKTKRGSSRQECVHRGRVPKGRRF